MSFVEPSASTSMLWYLLALIGHSQLVWLNTAALNTHLDRLQFHQQQNGGKRSSHEWDSVCFYKPNEWFAPHTRETAVEPWADTRMLSSSDRTAPRMPVLAASGSLKSAPNVLTATILMYAIRAGITVCSQIWFVFHEWTHSWTRTNFARTFFDSQSRMNTSVKCEQNFCMGIFLTRV